ncbi:MAG: septation protein A [Cohaesibacteraceae bacterium]|nr:septation protein A [Cohaesibacteraceae bacterium]
MSNIESTKTPQANEPGQVLKLILEMGPLAIFFLANSKGEKIAAAFNVFEGVSGIFLATGSFMAATIIALSVSYILFRKLPIMPIVSGVVVMVFGGLTLYFQDELFIKLKPTIINCLFGGLLLGGLAFGKSFLSYVFGTVFRLTPKGWNVLSFRWGIFFFCLAALNEVVWRNFSTDIWVDFKVFGMMPITFIFTAFQLPLISRESLDNIKEKSAE